MCANVLHYSERFTSILFLILFLNGKDKNFNHKRAEIKIIDKFVMGGCVLLSNEHTYTKYTSDCGKTIWNGRFKLEPTYSTGGL